MITLHWEEIDDPHYTAHRAAVPGGWLIRLDGNVPALPSLVFVPDPGHLWNELWEPPVPVEPAVFNARSQRLL